MHSWNYIINVLWDLAFVSTASTFFYWFCLKKLLKISKIQTPRNTEHAQQKAAETAVYLYLNFLRDTSATESGNLKKTKNKKNPQTQNIHLSQHYSSKSCAIFTTHFLL